ncbi:MAG: hypothetical protein INQ03_10980 [Candidatus Heimdallarchaeota archaeon]|nr:hypothetical protein [Candidatus Heimdallarchaeota archaeon]
MVFSTVLLDASSSIIGNLGKKAIDGFLNVITDWPRDPEEGINRAKGAKTSTEASLKRLEDDMTEVVKFLTKEGQMQPLRKISSLKEKLTSVRHEIESKSGSYTMDNSLKDEDMLKAYTTVYFTVLYDSMICDTVVDQMQDRIYDDDFEMDDLVKKMRTGINNLENSWAMYMRVIADPKIAKSAYQELKSTRKDLIEFMEEVDKHTRGEMDMLVSGVILNKPKIFGKKKYIESLAALMHETAKHMGEIKISIPQIFDKIRQSNPNAQFSDEDIEKAADLLIEHNRAFALTLEDNIKWIEFRKGDESLVCGNCSISGGIYREFKRCEITGKQVCEDCITFFGKCKICGQKVKHGKHPNI